MCLTQVLKVAGGNLKTPAKRRAKSYVTQEGAHLGAVSNMEILCMSMNLRGTSSSFRIPLDFHRHL
jgi:hypothetical protein